MNIYCRLGGMMLSLALSGCAGMHLYSEKRDLQGQDLKVAWAKVDLDGYFAAMQEQRKKMLQADLDAIGGARSAEVDSALVLMLDAPVNATGNGMRISVHSLVSAELDMLGRGLGSTANVQRIADYKANVIVLEGNRATQASYRKLILAEGGAALACPAKALPGAPAANDYAQEYLGQLATLCGAEEKLVAQQAGIVGQLPAGDLKAAADTATELGKTHARAAADADQAMATYRRALDDYAAAARASAPGAAPSQKMAEAGTRVRGLLAGLGTASNVLGGEAVSSENMARIDAILARLGTTADPGADATRSELAAVLVTRVADDVQVLAELGKPLVPASLLIQRDLEKNRADLAKFQADLYRKDLDLARAVQASRVEEASGLQASLRLAGLIKPCYQQQRFLDAVSIPKTRQPCDDATSRANLYDAAGHFLHAIGEQHAQSVRLEQMRRDVKRERQLAYDQANARQWAVLIDATAGQAVAWSASGQKASDYNSLIQTLSLLWIGNGVSK